jgi:YihY family inner membrane protein
MVATSKRQFDKAMEAGPCSETVAERPPTQGTCEALADECSSGRFAGRAAGKGPKNTSGGSMPTAAFVPETHRLSGDDAAETISRTGRIRLVQDAFTRFRHADGFSHVRALAYTTVMGLVTILVAVIGLSTLLGLGTFQRALTGTLEQLAPSNTGSVLADAIRHAEHGSGVAALVFGGLSAIVVGAVGMAQVERSANRTYGLLTDRPFVRKYLCALGLYVVAGIPLLVGLVLLALGGALGQALTSAAGWSHAWSTAWSIARWPVGIAAIWLGLTILFRLAPNRHQPEPSWLSMGTLLAMVLWVIFTLGLGLYYAVNTTAAATYGPLIGVIAVMVWAYLSSLAIHLGIAFAAQLEAVRSGPSGGVTIIVHGDEESGPIHAPNEAVEMKESHGH